MKKQLRKKRTAFKRRALEALRVALNDPLVMPNFDCSDIIVSVNWINFGSTVRTIFVGVSAHWREPAVAIGSYLRYEQRARELGRDPPWYDDFDDTIYFGSYQEPLADELQRLLELRYAPSVTLSASSTPERWPNSNHLFDCARRMASEFDSRVSNKELISCIHRVLFLPPPEGKNAWACLVDGILTEVEMRNLLLAHLETLIESRGGKRLSEMSETSSANVLRDFDRALFGGTANDISP